MSRDSENYRLLIENLPDAFAYHQIVADDDGTPVDYIFLEVNAAFEEMTGLKREGLIGKKVTVVLPGIEKSEFDWIGTYGKVAQGGEAIRFESFSEPLGRWYDVRAYSDEPECFATVLRDISKHKDMETNLHDMSGRLKAIIDNSPLLISEFKTNGQFLMANKAVTDLFNIAPSEIAGCHFEDFLLPETVILFNERINSVVSKKGPIRVDDQITVDDKIYYYMSTLFPLCDSSGRVSSIGSIAHDITDRIEVENALRESEEKLSGILNNMTDVVWSISWPDFRHIYRSPALEKLYGRSAQEFNDNPTLFKEVTHPEDQHLTEKAIEQLLEEGEAVRECRVVRPDGSIIWINDRSKLIYDEDQQPIRVDGVTQDITERKQAENALRENEELLRTINETVGEGVALKDASDRFVHWNKTASDIFGLDIEHARGQTPAVFDIKFIYEDGTEYAGDDYPSQHTLRTGESCNNAIMGLKRNDHSITWLKINTRPIFKSGDTKPHQVVISFSDITDHKKTEEALKLQASERAAVDTFTYSVSNDLQAPLRRIEGFSEALLEECTEELSNQARDYLNRIVTQVGSMKNLTDALLQLSKVVSREIDREEVDLSALTRSNLEKLQYEEPERQIELVVTPGLITEGDPELLNLMLAKLLDNAWIFTSEVEEAKIEFGSKEQNGRTVYYLKDNGIGFDMNHAEKLFAPFQKLHSGSTYPGIGIGLNLAYRIISRHGGEIWAEGEEGKGACFYFTLP